MKRALLSLGCAAALSLTASSVAQAAETAFISNQQFCGGNTFSTCAYITATTEVVGGNTVLKLYVTNPVTNPAGSTFTAIGVADLNGATLVGTPTANDPNFTYSVGPTGLSGAGILSDIIGFNSNVPVPANGILPGETVIFTFTFSGTSLNTADLQFAIHDQGGAPADCASSTKLVVDNTTPNGVWAANSATCGPPTTVTPEPASMVLFGTGLVGLGGIVVRRRKNVA